VTSLTSLHKVLRSYFFLAKTCSGCKVNLVRAVWGGRRWSSNPSGKCSYELPTRGTVCGTIPSMCGADAGCLAINYQSLSGRSAGSWRTATRAGCPWGHIPKGGWPLLRGGGPISSFWMFQPKPSASPPQIGGLLENDNPVQIPAEEGRRKATWKREFKLPWREAGPPNHHDDKVDSDQKVVNKELSLWQIGGFLENDNPGGWPMGACFSRQVFCRRPETLNRKPYTLNPKP